MFSYVERITTCSKWLISKIFFEKFLIKKLQFSIWYYFYNISLNDKFESEIKNCISKPNLRVSSTLKPDYFSKMPMKNSIFPLLYITLYKYRLLYLNL